MTRGTSLLLVLLLAASVSAFGQVLDPNIMVGSLAGGCPGACSGDPTSITSSGFDLFINGNAGNATTWFIILALPGMNGSPDPAAPTVTSDPSSPDSFTIGAGVDAGTPTATTDFTSSTAGDVYAFVGSATGNLQGDNSMNAGNMFGSAEQAAFGGTPDFFEIFVYSVTEALPTQVNELFDASLTAGTFVMAVGTDAKGQQFSTPFTTAGLVTGSSSSSTSSTTTTTTTNTTASGPFNTGGGVPEPSGVVLFGSALVAVSAILRKKFVRS